MSELRSHGCAKWCMLQMFELRREPRLLIVTGRKLGKAGKRELSGLLYYSRANRSCHSKMPRVQLCLSDESVRPQNRLQVSANQGCISVVSVMYPRLVIAPLSPRYSAYKNSLSNHAHQINFLRCGWRGHRLFLSRSDESRSSVDRFRHVPRSRRERGHEQSAGCTRSAED